MQHDVEHPRRRMTFAEWDAMEEDEPGELVDGELVEEEVPNYAHEVIALWLASALMNWVLPRGGFAAGSDAKFAVSKRRGRKPDATAYLPGTRPPPKKGIVRHPPDIAVEVISADPRDARRDRLDKMDEYAAFGVRWYWLVDPEARTLEVFELGEDSRYTRAVAAAEGTLAPPGCEGLLLDLTALWALVDRLDASEERA